MGWKRKKKKGEGGAAPAQGGGADGGESLRLGLAERPPLLRGFSCSTPGAEFVAAARPLLAFLSRLARALDAGFAEPRVLRSEEYEEVPYDYERRTLLVGGEGAGLRVVCHVGCDAGSGFTNRHVLTVTAYGLAGGLGLEFEHHDFVAPFGSREPEHFVELRVGGAGGAAGEVFRAFRDAF